MSSEMYQWQGAPCDVIFGYVHQVENTSKPLYWYNFDCYHRQELDGSWKIDHMVGADGLHFSLIPSVKVTQGNQSFLMANHHGLAVHKLLNGGWPNYRHSSLDGEFHECNRPEYAIKEFDEYGLNEYDAARLNWMHKNYPIEMQDLELLRRSAIGFRK